MIQLNYPQITIPGNATPQIQSWSPVNNKKKYYMPIGQTSIFHTVINIKIKDVVGVPLYSQYSEFRLVAYQQYSQNSPFNWIDESSYNTAGYPTDINSPIPITITGLNYNFYPVFQNLQLLNQGDYSFTLFFRIEGKTAGNIWNVIDTYQYKVSVNVSSVALAFSPATLIYNKEIGIATNTQEVILDGPSWKISFGSKLTCVPQDLEGLVYTSPGYGIGVYTGNGYRKFDFGINDTYYDTIAPSTVPEIEYINIETINPGSAPNLSIIEANIFIQQPNQLSITPSSFNFQASKGLVEPTPQIGFLNGSAAYTMTTPPWLIVTPGNIIDQSVLIGNLTVVPIPTSNMVLGNYSGNIVFTYTNAFGTQSQLIVPVTYQLNSIVNDPYAGQENAFTLDNKFYEINTDLQDTYFQLNSEIKVYDFFNNEETIVLSPDKLPLFYGKGKINFGKRIHQVMKKFTEPNNNFFQYKQALFTLELVEMSHATNTILRTFNLNAQKFVAGLSEFVTASPTLLKISQEPTRVTKNSYAFINMLLPAGNFLMLTNKNNNQVDSYSITSSGGIFTKKIYFSDFSPGDKITIQLLDPITGIISPTQNIFLMFPDSRYSNQIVWENNFLLQNNLEFTGGFSLKPDYESTTQTTYKDLVEVMEIIENKKVSKFSINTGWVLKSDNITVDSLLRSKKAWLITPDENISLRPLTKTILQEDSERELVMYDVEFQINRSYDEKNYKF